MAPHCGWRRKLHVLWRWFDERIAEKMEATTLSNTGASLTSGFIIAALIVAAAVLAQANAGRIRHQSPKRRPINRVEN